MYRAYTIIAKPHSQWRKKQFLNGFISIPVVSHPPQLCHSRIINTPRLKTSCYFKVRWLFLFLEQSKMRMRARLCFGNCCDVRVWSIVADYPLQLWELASFLLDSNYGNSLCCLVARLVFLSAYQLFLCLPSSNLTLYREVIQ